MNTDNTTDLDKRPVAASRALSSSVPVIDIAGLRSEASAPVLDAISAACREWGFFQIVNHGIANDLIEAVWRQTRRFFAAPSPLKRSILRSRDNPWGFYNNELTKNQRDRKEVFDFTSEGVDPIYKSENRWPDLDGGFRATMLAYLTACTGLSLRLLAAFCSGLGLPADCLRKYFVPEHTGFVRLNLYPVADPMAGAEVDHLPLADLGVHHHTDAGALTVLLQDDTGGLQVYHDGCWHDIAPVPGALVINTGDMMQVWSNDLYRAATHRVLAMHNRDRYSVPFFFNPAANSRVSPLPAVVSAERPRAYRTIDWAAFRARRTEGDYADYGSEVQIAQFRL